MEWVVEEESSKYQLQPHGQLQTRRMTCCGSYALVGFFLFHSLVILYEGRWWYFSFQLGEDIQTWMEDPRLLRHTWWVIGVMWWVNGFMCSHLGRGSQASVQVQRVVAFRQAEHRVLVAWRFDRQRGQGKDSAAKWLDHAFHLPVLLSDPFGPPSFSTLACFHRKIHFPNSLAKFRSFAEMGGIGRKKQEGRRKGEARISLPFTLCPMGHPLQLPSNNAPSTLPAPAGSPATGPVSCPLPWLWNTATLKPRGFGPQAGGAPCSPLPLGPSPPHLWLP